MQRTGTDTKIGRIMLETPARIEPYGIEETIPVGLPDLVLDIRSEAELLGRRPHPDSAAELPAMTKIMNAYYANLIEGQSTRSRDIEGGFLKSATPKGPVRIAFLLTYRERLFPNLFSDAEPVVPPPPAPPAF